jgi:EAL domain-containing protein (putative c-di-GMP-specific phosphodiesterase class I)/CHASE2 domain-containing sensor protein
MRSLTRLRRHLRIDRRLSTWILLAAIVLSGILVTMGPMERSIERALMPARFAAKHRIASGNVLVVEMDADSIAKIKRWPWSRSNYAQVVDRLRQAGAASIVFDVDLSATADAEGDRAFADALARANGLVALPTFGQDAGSGDRRTIDTIPLPQFRKSVALASVSIRPDADGLVRNMPLGTITAGTPRPTLSGYIAAVMGSADRDFLIDQSIDPDTIPRLSFVAVRDGRFDPAQVRGRNVLIGATAIEMGDRYGTSQWGVIPGVVIQAMAAETLLRGIPVDGWPGTTILIAGLIAALALSFRSSIPGLGIAATGGAAMIIATLVAQHRFQLIYPLAVPLLMIAATAAVSLSRDVVTRFREARSIDEATGLPNTLALVTDGKAQESAVLAVATIGNHDALRAILGPRDLANAIIRTGERMALIALDHHVYRTAEHQLAFLLPPDQASDDTLHGLRAILLQPVEIGGRRVDVSISIGIASGAGTELDRMVSDAALAAAKAQSDGVFWRRAATDIDGLERSVSLMGELDEAIARGEIEVFYQPKYHLGDRRIVSVEALVRWRHPVRGFIGPDLFIPIAEKTNRIAPLTLHVLAQVARDIPVMRSHAADLTAAINLSANLLSSTVFNREVERIIAEADVPTAALVFEVTESAAMSHPVEAIAALRRYRDLGIAVSLDDYGTGQSTLTYLRQLPITELKIDKSFVQNAHIDHNDGVLVRSTIDLAHRLGLKVVAEGVEDQACLDYLAACDCDLIQGYFISKPLPLAALGTLLAERRSNAA